MRLQDDPETIRCGMLSGHTAILDVTQNSNLSKKVRELKYKLFAATETATPAWACAVTTGVVLLAKMETIHGAPMHSLPRLK